jgi:hypothetical protein
VILVVPKEEQNYICDETDTDTAPSRHLVIKQTPGDEAYEEDAHKGQNSGRVHNIVL